MSTIMDAASRIRMTLGDYLMQIATAAEQIERQAEMIKSLNATVAEQATKIEGLNKTGLTEVQQ